MTRPGRVYALAAAIAVAATAIRWLLDPWLGHEAPLLLQALGIVIAGWYGGGRAAILTTVIGLVLGWYLLIPERWSFTIRDPEKRWNIALYVIAGATLGLLSSRMHRLMDASRRNEELFRRTVQRAPFPLMLHNESGDVLEINEAWTSITGYSALTVADWVARAQVDKQDVLSPNAECRIRAQSGEVRIWNLRSSPVGRDGSGKQLILTAANDVTERAAAAQKLQATIESITDGLLILDHDWRCTYISSTGARMLGMETPDLVGRILWDVFPNSTSTKFYSEYHRAAATRQPVHFDEFYPAPVNRWFECHCYPSTEGLSVFFRDVTERKQVEKTLRERTSELDSLLENAPIGFAFFDRDHRYVRINERLAEINGIPVAQHLGRHIRDVLPVNALSVEPVLEKVFTTARPVITEIIGETPKDPGVQRIWHVGFYPVFGESGISQVGAFVFETTEQRRAEQAVRESTDRLHLALRSANMGTFDIAIATNELAWDTRSFELFHADPSAGITFDSAMAQVHEEDRERVNQAIRAACLPDSGGNYQIEYRIIWPDGTQRWILSTGRVLFDGEAPVRLTGINHDVTERKQGELALQESQERFRIAADAAALGLFEWDAATDQLYFHDDRAKDILAPQAPATPRLSELLHPQDREAFAAAIDECRATSGSLDITVRVGERWVRLEGTFRSPVRLLAIAQDITESRRLQQALQESQAYLSAVIEGLPVGVGTTDRHGRILTMNAVGLRLHGFASLDDMLTGIDQYRAEFQMLYPDGRPMPEDEWPFARAVRGEYVADYELVLRRPRAGVEFILSYTTVPVRGGADLIIYVMQDVTERRAAEQRLRASEAQYRTLFESIDEGFCVIEIILDAQGSAVDYRFLEANPAFERHTGLVNAVGRTARELIPGLDESWFRIYGQVASTGEPVRFENDAPAMNRAFDVYALRVGAPEQRRVALLFTDITARKQNERAILAARQEAESQRRLLDAVLESLPVGVIIADAEGRLLRWNRANATLWGLHGVDPQDTSSIEQYRKWRGWWPDSGKPLEPHEWAMARALLHREVCAGELVEIERFDGTGRRFMMNMGAPVIGANGNLMGAVVAQTDVTDRVSIERALRESEDKFRTISEHIPQLAWMADSSGRKLWQNQRWIEYTGSLAADDGTPFGTGVHPDDAALVQKRWQHSLRTGEQFDAEFRRRRHDAVYEWFLGRAVAIRDEAGNVVRWFGTDTGIHQQKLTEAALRRSNEDLQQFAYVASHDLQEPLRTVVSFSQLLTRRYSEHLENDAREMVEFMADAALRMSFLVRDLLLYSRVTRDAEKVHGMVDLDQVLGEVLGDLRSSIEDTGAVIEHAPLPVVLGDRMQLGQVLLNLISNALKYRKQGVAPYVQIRCEQRLTDWLISIRDNGQGFDQEFADRIFGIFKRLHGREVPGTGIGLAICKTVIERHGGAIWTESQPGEGATFYFTLPIA